MTAEKREWHLRKYLTAILLAYRENLIHILHDRIKVNVSFSGKNFSIWKFIEAIWKAETTNGMKQTWESFNVLSVFQKWVRKDMGECDKTAFYQYSRYEIISFRAAELIGASWNSIYSRRLIFEIFRKTPLDIVGNLMCITVCCAWVATAETSIVCDVSFHVRAKRSGVVDREAANGMTRKSNRWNEDESSISLEIESHFGS